MTPDERKALERRFGKKKPRAKATPADPGSGPAGETCGTCKHRYANMLRSGRKFFKCKLLKPSRGPGTDIRVKTPACARWERADG